MRALKQTGLAQESMFNSGILDVAIGIVFVYLLVSLIVSAANELITPFSKCAPGPVARRFESAARGDEPPQHRQTSL